VSIKVRFVIARAKARSNPEIGVKIDWIASTSSRNDGLTQFIEHSRGVVLTKIVSLQDFVKNRSKS
jgi:hypothetical protein